MDFPPHAFTLRQLQYIVAVAETGSFSNAALACHVSQPSLSAQVAKVEEALGTVLFERMARGAELTGAGRGLLPFMRDLLRGADDIANRADRERRSDRVSLRVGVLPTVAPYLLAPWVDALADKMPNTTVFWEEATTASVERSVVSGRMDAAVIADPPSISGLEHRSVGSEDFVVLVAANHPQTEAMSLDELSSETVLLLAEGHCLSDQTLALCLRPEARLSPFRATSLPTLVQMVAAGNGVTVLPISAVGVETAGGRVRALPFRGAHPHRVLRMIWRGSNPLAPTVHRLGDALGDVLQACAGRATMSR